MIQQAEDNRWQAGNAAPDLEQLDNLEETVHIDKKRDGVTADEERPVC